MKELIKKLVAGENLTGEQAGRAMDLMLDGKATEAQMASYLTALMIKGETVEEIVGSCKTVKKKGGTVNLSADDYIDFVGTGGDGTNTFNISTTSMFVCAAAGVTVAKHGNRAASSKSGAADLLETLGVRIFLEPEQVSECINEIGVGFMNAQKFFGAMKNVAGVRKDLGIRTIFNMLGPLLNPSNASRQVIGVFSKDMVSVFSHCMCEMGVKNALVVHGNDGMDEITTTAKTFVNEIRNGEILEYEIDPADYGIEYAKPEDLRGGDAAENAEITRGIFRGEKGAKRDIVVLNSACGIYISGKAGSITEGVKIAQDMLDSGKAMEKLEEMIKKTKELAA